MFETANSLSTGAAPVTRVGNSKGDGFVNDTGNEHSLVARQNSLAEGQSLATFVVNLNSTCSINAVGRALDGL